MNDASVPTPEEVLESESSVYLATSEAGSPRVRPVTVVKTGGALYVLTGTNSKKIEQIRSDKRVEVLRMVEHSGNRGYLRITGEAQIVEDATTKKMVADATTYFQTYWSEADDPNYALIRIDPTKVAYMAPGEFEESEIDNLSLDEN
ncbi:MAG: pyridoxamine 5'-phosphate oxidase family protein [Candidatus Thorarchaeota archaeon]|jgi:general stress protein 26